MPDTRNIIKDLVIDLIKDDPEAAREKFHTMLGDKMRSRVSPESTEVETTVEVDDDIPGDTEDADDSSVTS